MQTAKVEIEIYEAQEALRQYRHARAPKTAQDIAIMQAYKAVARGKKIIRAKESIRQAGVDELGRPKLAIARADAKRCECQLGSESIEFCDPTKSYRATTSRIHVEWPQDLRRTLHYKVWTRHQAIVPLIPLHLRPRGSLVPYHILWEADWKQVPVDPMLLRKLSGDLWLVCAAWDLTTVEQAVLAGSL